MPVVLLKTATQQILHAAKRSISSAGKSSSFADSADHGRYSFGNDRSRQSSFERMNHSMPAELTSLSETERLKEVDEVNREHGDAALQSPPCNRGAIKKSKKELDGDVSRPHFQNMFSLRSFGASKSTTPAIDRDDSSSSRIAGFFRRKRESNDSLGGSTVGEDHTREHRVPFFFRKRSDVSSTSKDDDDDWPRSLGIFGGASNKKKNEQENGA